MRTDETPDQTSEYVIQKRGGEPGVQHTEKRSSDLGMLTLAKLSVIVVGTLTVSGAVNSALFDKKIADLELRLSEKSALKSQVVDVATYRAEKHEEEMRVNRLEATSEAQRQLIQQMQTDMQQIRSERLKK